MCGLALALFVVGQGVTQFFVADVRDGLARSVAFFVVWLAVPIFQFASLLLGRNHEPPPPTTPVEEE